MSIVKSPITVMATFLWIGFVCAISFLEAWLKFQAPGITLSLGLGIGRLVFNMLNKVEWVFAIAIFINLIIQAKKGFKLPYLVFIIPLVLLAIQSIWLLPALDARAELYIQNQPVPPSNNHFYYVGMEALKVISLVVFGISQFKKQTI
ncbi:hypothetical protein [Arcticibacterium luteifluviistationis]|uniref:DUF4149 domain-containing protein n=1 Tax=Arcticibacterium luteifluviistationis TaxID=1784714 RepID=A0A2Z4GBY3_9BACT|nr:hypothetical protein [Arcticibacterium luteifluviistationis]AWV98809.1 hypothetical protein DJ013_11755 [Arcticibacterium luteifluviistationis]